MNLPIHVKNMVYTSKTFYMHTTLKAVEATSIN